MVFRTRVGESEYNWGKLGDDVVGMRGPVETALGGDILGQSLVSHARGAISILTALALCFKQAGPCLTSSMV